MRLEDLTGAVAYKTAGGDVAKAFVNTRVRYSRPEDTTYPEPYRNAVNDAGWHISITQRAIDAGEVWQTEDDPEAILAAYWRNRPAPA